MRSLLPRLVYVLFFLFFAFLSPLLLLSYLFLSVVLMYYLFSRGRVEAGFFARFAVCVSLLIIILLGFLVSLLFYDSYVLVAWRLYPGGTPKDFERRLGLAALLTFIVSCFVIAVLFFVFRRFFLPKILRCSQHPAK